MHRSRGLATAPDPRARIGAPLLRGSGARVHGVIRRPAGNAPRRLDVRSLTGHDRRAGHSEPDETVAPIVPGAGGYLLREAARGKFLGKIRDRVARGGNAQSGSRQGARNSTLQHVTLLCEFVLTNRAWETTT